MKKSLLALLFFFFCSTACDSPPSNYHVMWSTWVSTVTISGSDHRTEFELKFGETTYYLKTSVEINSYWEEGNYEFEYPNVVLFPTSGQPHIAPSLGTLNEDNSTLTFEVLQGSKLVFTR